MEIFLTSDHDWFNILSKGVGRHLFHTSESSIIDTIFTGIVKPRKLEIDREQE